MKVEDWKSPTLEEIVGSMALRSLTRLPSRQKVKLARGNSSPGSVQRHLTSGPIFSITSNLTIPPSTRSSSPTFTSVSYAKLFLNSKENVLSPHRMKIVRDESFNYNMGLENMTFSKAIIVDTNGVIRQR